MKTILMACLLTVSAVAHAETGIATYYNDTKMADGSVYGAHGHIFCAASPDIRLGTVYKVLSKRTGKMAYVTVRDHGPLTRRHLDLSQDAFRYLFGGTDSGVETIEFNVSTSSRHLNDRHTNRRRTNGRHQGRRSKRTT